MTGRGAEIINYDPAYKCTKGKGTPGDSGRSPLIASSLGLPVSSVCLNEKTPAPMHSRRFNVRSRPKFTRSWIILAVIFCCQSKLAQSKPVLSGLSNSADLAKCFSSSKSLVNVVSETLLEIKSNFNCSYDEIYMVNVISKDKMNVLTSCIPSSVAKDHMCTTLNRADFDEAKCLKAIHADLKVFKDELQELTPSLNAAINQLMQDLKVGDTEENNVKKGSCSSFNCKLEQCRVILFYHLRTITFSRVLNYLRSTKDKEPSTKDLKKQ
ncbi:hypothetical protein XELAEV_18027650mg [Xenopus laevis]|uniref:Interleukin-12 subunit alpha n=1 Tax=Xenopus laevis TaxID=8355 RepID=A0A974HK57_XENLA|nr:hypothetical protein XELAEV_18027650mg [Xenopus laevis]